MKGHHIAPINVFTTKDNPLGYFLITFINLKGESVTKWFWAPNLKSDNREFKSCFDH